MIEWYAGGVPGRPHDRHGASGVRFVHRSGPTSARCRGSRRTAPGSTTWRGGGQPSRARHLASPPGRHRSHCSDVREFTHPGREALHVSVIRTASRGADVCLTRPGLTWPPIPRWCCPGVAGHDRGRPADPACPIDQQPADPAIIELLRAEDLRAARCCTAAPAVCPCRRIGRDHRRCRGDAGEFWWDASSRTCTPPPTTACTSRYPHRLPTRHFEWGWAERHMLAGTEASRSAPSCSTRHARRGAAIIAAIVESGYEPCTNQARRR